MTYKIKVTGYESLVRDTVSNAIVNTNVSEYNRYMQRIKVRESQNDQIRNTVKEINNLKVELRELKEMIKEVLNK